MIQLLLPPLDKLIYLKDGNYISQYFGEGHILNDCTLLSRNPFIIGSNSRKYFFTSNEAEDLPEGIEYALLTYKKPNKKDFDSGILKIKRWLKNPEFRTLLPEEVCSSWTDKFKYVKENIDGKKEGLRPPQIGALHSILSHIQVGEDVGIVVMPTGTGKTETMLCTLIANQCTKLLVAVPSDSLRIQLSEKFLTLGLLKKFQIVENSCFNPIVGVINSKFNTLDDLKEFISKSNVVVTTMSILSSCSSDSKAFLANEFSHLFVDEAHHSQAESWNEFLQHFKKEKIFLFTATPYRNDGKQLEGKFIFTFSLKKAQEQKYYKKINYLPIREYNKKKADEAIAEKAVIQLRDDISKGFNHIIMARCGNKERAKKVFEYYKKYEDLKAILVYTNVPGLSKKIEAIKRKEYNVIVCVDMLGEGFDLPELKIAALHDERQSLPITLQFIGRFTRTSYNELGEASFITNLAYPPIKEELDQLYAKDSDWNLLLPTLSEGATKKEIDFKDFLSGFNHLNDSIIPFQNIYPAMSSVVYRNGSNTWNPTNWKEGISDIGTFQHQFSDHNPKKNTLIIILGKIINVEWGSFDIVKNMDWDLIVVHWDYRPKKNLVFVHTSLKNFSPDKLVQALFGETFKMINGMDVFKIFHNVRMLTLYNVGARRGTGRDITFQSFFGRGVQDGIKLLEAGTLIKNNIFGIGFKEGEKISLGCSVKGKIWSYLRGNLDELIKWSREMGNILEDPAIDSNVVLKNTIIPITIKERPKVMPISADWHPSMYEHNEDKYEIIIDGLTYDLSNSELNIVETPLSLPLRFSLNCEENSFEYELLLGEKEVDGRLESIHEIKQLTSGKPIIVHANKKMSLVDFFQIYTPTIWFSDGSQLFQNRYVIPKESPGILSLDSIISDKWEGVSLNKESQGIYPYVTDSIQYYFINKIRNDFQIIYDDDGSGEIADVIGINDSDKQIDIHLYHLKFAKGGIANKNIDNFYQVCGQAQKSLRWKHRKGKDFFNHLLKRKTKSKGGKSCSRLIKGTEEQLELLLTAAKWTKEMKFNIYIVQPSLKKVDPSNDILLLLGNTQYYLQTIGNVNLIVYSS